MFMDNWFHSFEPTWHCWMVLRKIEFLRCVLGPEIPVLHSWFILLVHPILVWNFHHFPGRQRIWSSFLIPGCIVKHKKTGCHPFHLAFKNIYCEVNLFDQVFGYKIAITTFSHIEDNMGLSVTNTEIRNWHCVDLKHSLSVMLQSAPLWCHQVWNHQGWPFALALGCWLIGCMIPLSFVLVICAKCRLIMCDKDQLKMVMLRHCKPSG